MAVKYQIDWKDSDGDSFVVQIYNAAYGGANNQLTGSGVITEDAGDLWQPVRSRFLTLKILVTTATKTLIDGLFDEADRYWTVACNKEGQRIFLGSLSTEPVEQPFNADVWEIQIECRDALGFLEDLAFVQDSGLNWTGSKTVIETIVLAVRRGYGEVSTVLDIRAHTNVTMIGLPGTLPFQENAYVQMDAFLSDDDEPDSCLEVLESMLEAMGCTIFQYEDELVIINIEKWVGMATGSVVYRRYSGSTGVYEGTNNWNVSAGFRDIGTQTDGNTVFHVNENASYFYEKYLQFSRLKHVYEFKDQILPNGEIIGGPTTMPNWSTFSPYGSVGTDLIALDGLDAGGPQIAALSEHIRINKDNVLKIIITVVYTATNNPLYWPISIQLIGLTQTWYYIKLSTSSEAFWQEGTANQQFLFGTAEAIQVGNFVHSIDVANLPVSGRLNIVLWTPYYATAGPSGAIVRSVEVSIPNPPQEGREFTAERTDKTTGRIEEPEEIRFCTSDTSVITNTFYNSFDVPINFVYYGGSLNDVYLLEALALARLRVQKARLHQFSGDIKGHIEHITPKEINSLTDGVFIIGRLDLDLTTGISSNTFLGANVTDGGATYDSETRIVYKDSIKPKIK